MNKNKKTIESFDKSFAIEKNLDKLVGGVGTTLISKDRVVGNNTISGDNPFNWGVDDCADDFIVY